jgi:2-phospho-L-lactate transferase/gluconeogenesis factor (CofD/UPF0052 family)/hydroxymethylpyrimidine pyrophosphatase-like HAD family hydrolase
VPGINWEKEDKMKILIVAGGTGSIALQTGLYEMLDKQLDGIETKVLVNAYDNGLSTGSVRRVMDGAILGPSDVRKNQTTRLRLEKPGSAWLPFLDIRFSCEASKTKAYCFEQIKNFTFELGVGYGIDPAIQAIRWGALSSEQIEKLDHTGQLLKEAVDTYFSMPSAMLIDYSDFSLANIIYAGFCKANGNSLRKAASIMAGLMDIKDNVILNSDESLFLGAISKSGVRVRDESDIVCWGNELDPFVDCFFTDATGDVTLPELCNEAETAIQEADLIILSSGTPWSSLIPTYKSMGFYTAIKNTNAKIIMVANKAPDKDSPGQSISELIDLIVPEYFPENKIHLLYDLTSSNVNQKNITAAANEKLRSTQAFNLADMAHSASKHNPAALAEAIGAIYFKEYLNSDHYMFDYDDTLVARGNKLPRSSQANRRSIHKIMFKGTGTEISICTGNSIKAINLRLTDEWRAPGSKGPRPLMVFADGGINQYEYRTELQNSGDDDTILNQYVLCTDPASLIKPADAEDLIEVLINMGIPSSKIENRHNALISIKPIDSEYKDIVRHLVDLVLSNDHIMPASNRNLMASNAGRTTIEIKKPSLDKTASVKHMLTIPGINSITFVGDECIFGNDANVKRLADAAPGGPIKCLQTTGPAMTAFFLTVLTSKLYNAKTM